MDMSVLQGYVISPHCFVDATLAGDKVTRRRQTRILIFFNRAPIVRHQKDQSTVETSTSRSVFTAMKNAEELVESLCYNLQMSGVSIDE